MRDPINALPLVTSQKQNSILMGQLSRMLTFKCPLTNRVSLQIGVKLPGNFTGKIRKAGPEFDIVIPNRGGRLMSGGAFIDNNWPWQTKNT
jgi:hypothetical protein